MCRGAVLAGLLFSGAGAQSVADPPECRTDIDQGQCVFGPAFHTSLVSSLEACCDLCGTMAAAGCVAWNLNGNSTHMNCALKNASSVGKRGGSCLANGMANPPPAPGPPPPGNFSVSMDTFELPHGWMCGGNTTQIYYPNELEKGPFPILAFGHGSGGSMLEPLQKEVASLGFVIVAPKTGCCNDAGNDQLGALLWTRNASLHKALGHVDFTRAGIYGHSFGSAWTSDAARKAQAQPDVYNVKAALFSHGGHNAANITLPSMFTSGRGGGAGSDMFSSSPAQYKVFAIAKGAGHMEPIQGGRLNGFDGHFLACHVAGLQTSCEKIYGSGDDSICKAQPMDACQVVQP